MNVRIRIDQLILARSLVSAGDALRAERAIHGEVERELAELIARSGAGVLAEAGQWARVVPSRIHLPDYLGDEGDYRALARSVAAAIYQGISQ